MILECSPPRPILRRFHNWNDRQNWPATQKWVCDTCKIDFEENCDGKCGNMRWECSVCFPGYQLSPDTEALNEHYRKLKERKEMVWISLGSAFVLIMLLALNGCIWRQKRNQRRTRARELDRSLQDRRLHHDRCMEGANPIKSARRVPVLPTIRSSQNPSPGNDTNPTAVGVKQRSGRPSGSHGAEVGPSSIPMASRIVRDGLPAMIGSTGREFIGL